VSLGLIDLSLAGSTLQTAGPAKENALLCLVNMEYSAVWLNQGRKCCWQVLVVPHRRLISFCCVMELREPGRFHPFANRQRGLFLFNDLLLASTSVLIPMFRDHIFPQQISPNSASQFAKFCGSPWQIFHI